MTPFNPDRRDEEGRRTTDGLRIMFPLPFVVQIATTVLIVASVIWTATYGLRSDVRDILTRMAYQVEIDKANSKIAEERANALRESVEAMKRRQELQQYEIQQLKEAILMLKPRS